MNTATLRNMARTAEANCQWAEAADLYQRAHDAYPTGLGGGLAARDKEYLNRKARSCRTMVVVNERLCETEAA
jgi:hypothetical protein